MLSGNTNAGSEFYSFALRVRQNEAQRFKRMSGKSVT